MSDLNKEPFQPTPTSGSFTHANTSGVENMNSGGGLGSTMNNAFNHFAALTHGTTGTDASLNNTAKFLGDSNMG